MNAIQRALTRRPTAAKEATRRPERSHSSRWRPGSGAPSQSPPSLDIGIDSKYIFRYVTVPRKQLNQDFSTNMLLKIYLCIILMLTMAPNIPQCTLKMLVIQPGPPFHFNEVEMVKKRD